MKVKTLIIILIIVTTVFLIYIKNIDDKIYLLNLTTTDEYTNEVLIYLNKTKKLEHYADNFINKTDRITDLIRYINENKKIKIKNKTYTIQNALIKSDITIIKIGELEVNYFENYDDIDEYLTDLNNLFTIIRKYCKEKIIYVGNYIENISYKNYIYEKEKNLCKKYKIEYVENDNLIIESEILNIINKDD